MVLSNQNILLLLGWTQVVCGALVFALQGVSGHFVHRYGEYFLTYNNWAGLTVFLTLVTCVTSAAFAALVICFGFIGLYWCGQGDLHYPEGHFDIKICTTVHSLEATIGAIEILAATLTVFSYGLKGCTNPLKDKEDSIEQMSSPQSKRN
ncbi:hypothetical protein CAPTEDRAFT_202439 [Capitella teleta]|uniref:Uncharacterized protein n=1 Tax=Capitella teleta TaxID=283909 RepID=R7U6C9_CAPTE|nr:hypothetical protein CAPTEDRAFT_202439 [Capitella teleta]|eukprot:ELT99236.1 hypothetical protein CAPTEDRAFT_202439 [Capitella teleta]